MNLVQTLDDRAREMPESIALIEGDRCVSFTELAARVCGGAEDLRRRGIGAGDLLLFLHPVSIDLYVALLATMRVGAVPMLVDPGAGIAGFRRAVRRTRPVAWCGSGKGLLVKWLLPELWPVPRTRPERSKQPGNFAPPEPVSNDAPALVTFTSGSTGVPKAAVRSHGFLLTQNAVLGKAIDLRPGEVDLVTLPVFALANLAHGVASVIAANDPGVQISRDGVTRCAVSPAFLGEWLDTGVPLGAMEKIFTGGGPVFPTLLDRLRKAAPAAWVCAVYGSTEAEPIAHLEMDEISEDDIARMRDGDGLLAGHPVPEIRLAILPDRWGQPIPQMDEAAFASMRLGHELAGEIVVSGDHVLSGYLGGVGDEETKFRVDGVVWHRTGDAGKLDIDGRLWLLGRCAAVLRDVRGELYPFAIETMLSFNPHIRRSAVVEVDGTRMLVVEADVAGVPVPPDGIDEVRRLDRIPVDRRHRAKIDYPALRKMLGAATSRYRTS